MKKTNLHILFAAITFVSFRAMALNLEVDRAHSSVSFDIKHLIVSTVHGNFTEFNGTIDLDEKKIESSKISFNVKTPSITTNNEKRDGHLKSPDFFDVAKFPEAKFQSTALKKKGKDEYEMQGDLTIHGITKKATFDLKYLGKVKDPYGAEKYIFHASTKIIRKDFGLIYNSKLESGGMLIGETADLVVDLEAAVPRPPEAK
jgi:polyisoprenoid-binding protein YceI